MIAKDASESKKFNFVLYFSDGLASSNHWSNCISFLCEAFSTGPYRSAQLSNRRLDNCSFNPPSGSGISGGPGMQTPSIRSFMKDKMKSGDAREREKIEVVVDAFVQGF